MSRMFSVLSGGSSARSTDGPEPSGPAVPRGRAGRSGSPAVGAPATADDDFVADAEEAPFLEIGGPGGPVFSAGPAAAESPAPVPAADPAPASAEPATLPVSRAPDVPPEHPARTYPRLASPGYLSVTFHDLIGRPRTGEEAEGPDPGLVALHLPDHPVSGEYRTLRDEVRAQLPDPTPRVLMFTAAAGEAGTTTVLLNLAVTLAREDAPRVLVVDANVTRPAVADRLALAPAPGLVEVLAMQVPLAWAVRSTVVPNLQVLPAGGDPAGAPVPVGADLPKLIEQLRQWYDWVLIDAGVWGVMPDLDAACPAADAVYLVSRAADVSRSEFAGLRGWVRELGGLARGYITTTRA